MLFPTVAFAVFFVAVLWLNALVFDRPGWRKTVLLLVSYGFYAAWDVRFLALMAGVSGTAWIAGLWVRHARWGRFARITAIAILLGCLGFFKYFNFFTLTLLQTLLSLGFERDMVWLSVLLPVGISFYIFQAISYVMDVARGTIAPRRNPLDIFLYISFFPQLVAGPIVRAAHFLPQIDAPSRPNRQAIAEGVVLILSGLFKKMVIANYISVLIVDPYYALPEGQNMITTVVAILGYGVQIYCDFSGYSDIAIGVALLLGYRFTRNFNQPYRAHSLRDFWQRWHISLSNWIRDYLYIPLGGNRGGPVRQSVVVITTMTLAGLWHGAGWNFLIWGALHGVGLAAERRFRSISSMVGVVYVFIVVQLLWVPFRAPTIGDVQETAAALLRWQGFAPVDVHPFGLFLIAAGLAMNWAPLSARDALCAWLGQWSAATQAVLLAFGTILCFAIAQKGTAPFIYFQF